MVTRYLSRFRIVAFISLLLFLYGLVYLHTHYDLFHYLQQRRESSQLSTKQPLLVPVSISLELKQIAQSQIQPWIGYKMNRSDVENFAKRKGYLYVVEINNGTLHIPEYIDKEFEYNQNVEPLIAVIQQILLEENNIQDTVLFLNLLDEPRNPNKIRCQQTGIWNKIENYHGFPLSFLEMEDKDMPQFPILSPAKISQCFEDILVPFGDLLELPKLAEMRSTIPSCYEGGLWNVTNRLMTAIFRGSPTGHSLREGRNHRLSLIKACDNEQSRHVRNYLVDSSFEDILKIFPDGGPLCDAAFTQQMEDLNLSQAASPSYFLPIQVWEQITFFVLDIDGNSYSRRLANLCFADVDIIRLGIFEDLLLMLLKNGTHYRHIQIDHSDLFSTLTYMRTHLHYSQQLCSNKFQRCRQIVDYSVMKYYVQTLLEEYSQQVLFLSPTQLVHID